MTSTHVDNMTPPETPFLGLAPFLRKSIAGTALLPLGQQMMTEATIHPDDANLWMNLSIVMLCLGHQDIGVSIQAQALELQRIYRLPATRQPAKLRVLMLMAPGDLAANTPLECLLENNDIDLVFYYISGGDDPLAQPIPEHDALLVAMSETDENRGSLLALESVLATWPKPVINAPQHIPLVGRELASELLQNAPGLQIPATLHATREVLQAIASSSKQLTETFTDCDFPIILRPVGSHAGRDLAKIDSPADITAYLARVDETEFFLSRFINYSGQDGLFRKFRIALVDGMPFACHMGISAHWMIHYVNAGMYEDAAKRAEEARFMADFDTFSRRHHAALNAIHTRTHLDYVCIDCAETPDGQLLIFEIDHAMVVHSMDPEDMFPYKAMHMQKLQNAMRNFLIRRSSGIQV
jgi:glutathione synthase/RimK-type ligase-like ATP-grasp enzyme